MRDPAKALRVAVYDALQALTFNGDAVPVCDVYAADEIGFPRILINDVGGSEDGSKSQFMYDYSVTLKISTRFEVNSTSNYADEIADGILQIMIPSPAGPWLTIEGFRAYLVALDSSTPQEYYIKPYKYIDRNIRLNIKLE